MFGVKFGRNFTSAKSEGFWALHLKMLLLPEGMWVIKIKNGTILQPNG